MISALKKIDSSFNCLFNEKGVESLGSISTPQSPRENTFVFIKNKKFLKQILLKNKINSLGIVFCSKYFEQISKEDLDTLKSNDYWLAVVDDFNVAMCRFSKFFYDKKRNEYSTLLDGRIAGNAKVDANSNIAQNVFIGENVIIEKNVTLMPGCIIHTNSKISEGTIIHSNVVVYPDVIIGKNCCIHSGTVIGAAGFGYNFINGKHEKIWHFGGVSIGDNVDIGSNTSIDEGTFSPTIIGSGTKIDNFCQVAHNCQIGQNVVMCGRSGCSGSVTIEDFVVFGAGAGVGPSAHIGKGAMIAACCIVGENSIVEAGQTVAGHPHMPLNKWLRMQAKARRL